MSGLETALMTVARTVARQAVSAWLGHRTAAKERSKDLSELIRVSFADKIHRRRLERQVEDIADGVLQRLQPYCDAEFRGLDESEQIAVLLAVAHTVSTADLSDSALFEADAKASRLTRRLRRRVPDDEATRALGEVGAQLYSLVLTECVEDYVHLVTHLAAFVPRAAQEMLNRLSDLGGEMCRMLDRLPVRRLDAPSGDGFDDEFRLEYLGLVSETLDELRFFGVDLENRAPRTTLSVAYISLNVTSGGERPVERSAVSRTEWRESIDSREATVRVEHALAGSARLLISGEAGSGKSTLLNWLAVTASRGGFTGPLAELNGWVPFLVKLRSYAGRRLPRPDQFLDDVASAITGHMPEAWVDRQLRRGRALLLVDGVDELTDAHRNQVRPWLRQLTSAYPSARIVVTSRPAAAAAGRLEDFGTATLARMSPADIRLFVAQWHAAAQDAGGLPAHVKALGRYEATLMSRLESSPHLHSLAATPLLCAMLCALNLDQQRQLPRNRMGLYEAALKLLLRRRDEYREVPSFASVTLDDKSKMDLLRDLAWRLTLYNKSVVPEADAIAWTGRRLEDMPQVTESADNVFLHLLHRCGVLREPVQDRIDFVHRTFQEYLAASEVAERDHVDLLIAKAHLKLWREIVIITAGHAIDPLRRKLLNGVLDRAENEPRHRRKLRLLAVACLETMSTVPGDVLPRIEACLDEVIPPRGMAEVRSLSSAGDYVLRRLPADLDALSEAAAAATVATASAINGAAALDVLARYGADGREQVVTELINAWNYFDPDEYARRVLARSPLRSGSLSISDPSVVPSLDHLGELANLHVELDHSGDLAALSGAPALRSLHVAGGPEVDLGVLAEHGDLETLEISCPVTADSLGALTKLTRLKRLWIRATPSASSLAFLAPLHDLESLNVYGLANVRDFSPLRDKPRLEEILLGGCRGLTDLHELGHHPGLLRLYLIKPSPANGLASVSDLFPRLRFLSLRYATGVTDLTPLTALVDMDHLDLEGCAEIEDLTPLAAMPSLQHLDLRACRRVTDVTPLRRLPHLRRLYLNGVGEGMDVAPLGSLSSLVIHIDEDQVITGEEHLPETVRIDRMAPRYFDD
ncbi:NACHT domain-containing protein [Actinosynnema sp. NPDC051121]